MQDRDWAHSMQSCGRLAQKTALVTGSSRGIGRAIALRFAQEGARVAVTYSTQEAMALRVCEELEQMGTEALCAHLDVTMRSSVQRVLAMIMERWGRLDVLVNNAGINKRGFFDEITDEDWDLIMDVNLKGPFICCQETFPYMIKQKEGRIINIASIAGQYHGPKTVHYAVSKAGVISLTKVLARYGAPHNILVNAVAPGIILTDQTRDELTGPAGEMIVGMTLLKRPGELRDVTSTCVLLASDEQSYITGQVISVSGGAYLG